MHDDEGLAAVLFLHLERLLGDFVVCLVPADALPLALAALARATHGVLQAIGMVDRIGHREAAHAELAVRNRVQRIAFDLFELVVLRVQKNAAAHMAARGRPMRGARDGVFPFVPLPFAVMVCGSIEIAEPLLVISHVFSSPMTFVSVPC